MPALPKSRVNVLAPAWQDKLDGHVISVAWSPDSQWLAAACVSGPIQIFYVKDGSKVCRLPGHAFGTTMIGWSPNGKQFASAGQDGKIKYWNMLQCSASHSMDAGAAWVEAIAWGAANGSGPLLGSAAGKKLPLWTMERELLREYPVHPSTTLSGGRCARKRRKSDLLQRPTGSWRFGARNRTSRLPSSNGRGLS